MLSMRSRPQQRDDLATTPKSNGSSGLNPSIQRTFSRLMRKLNEEDAPSPPSNATTPRNRDIECGTAPKTSHGFKSSGGSASSVRPSRKREEGGLGGQVAQLVRKLSNPRRGYAQADGAVSGREVSDANSWPRKQEGQLATNAGKAGQGREEGGIGASSSVPSRTSLGGQAVQFVRKMSFPRRATGEINSGGMKVGRQGDPNRPSTAQPGISVRKKSSTEPRTVGNQGERGRPDESPRPLQTGAHARGPMQRPATSPAYRTSQGGRPAINSPPPGDYVAGCSDVGYASDHRGQASTSPRSAAAPRLAGPQAQEPLSYGYESPEVRQAGYPGVPGAQATGSGPSPRNRYRPSSVVLSPNVDSESSCDSPASASKHIAIRSPSSTTSSDIIASGNSSGSGNRRASRFSPGSEDGGQGWNNGPQAASKGTLPAGYDPEGGEKSSGNRRVAAHTEEQRRGRGVNRAGAMTGANGDELQRCLSGDNSDEEGEPRHPRGGHKPQDRRSGERAAVQQAGANAERLTLMLSDDDGHENQGVRGGRGRKGAAQQQPANQKDQEERVCRNLSDDDSGDELTFLKAPLANKSTLKPAKESQHTVAPKAASQPQRLSVKVGRNQSDDDSEEEPVRVMKPQKQQQRTAERKSTAAKRVQHGQEGVQQQKPSEGRSPQDGKVKNGQLAGGRREKGQRKLHRMLSEDEEDYLCINHESKEEPSKGGVFGKKLSAAQDHSREGKAQPRAVPAGHRKVQAAGGKLSRSLSDDDSSDDEISGIKA